MKIEQGLKLKDIADLLNADFAGDPEQIITGINEIHKVENGDITFVDYDKYYDKALLSNASAVIINKKLTCPPGKLLIYSVDPFRDYVALVKKLRPFEAATKMISKTAIIGEGTVIQPNVFIGNHVTIGRNCLIHPNVSIYDHIVIGDNVIIHSNAVIGADAYYFKRREEGYDKLESCGRVVIGDNVEIGALTAIDKGVSGDTVIGNGTKLDNHIQVGHDTIIGKNVLIGSFCAIGGVTEIQDDVVLWANVMVNKDIVIGKGAVILALSGVDKSLKGGKTYWGAPVDDARKKWRELALIRKLPEMIEKLKGF